MALTVSIYRDARLRGDCTNGGISGLEAGNVGLTLMNVNGPDDEPREGFPPALLVPHLCFGEQKGRRLARIVPAVHAPNDVELGACEWVPASGWAMFGGNYAATSDSRFWEKLREVLELEPHEFTGTNGAVPIHDRFE